MISTTTILFLGVCNDRARGAGEFLQRCGDAAADAHILISPVTSVINKGKNQSILREFTDLSCLTHIFSI
jgi:hypothetical protein